MRKQIVIVGCGFAGLHAAIYLNHRSVHHWADITVVDPRGYHLFTPLLHEAAAGLIHTDRLMYPVEPLLKQMGAIYRQATVRRVQLETKSLLVDDGELFYDALIVATGSQSHIPEEVDTQFCSLQLKTIEDAYRVKAAITTQVAKAIALKERHREQVLTFVIVGGGTTGVELAMALDQSLKSRLSASGISPGEVRILILEAASGLLPKMPELLRHAAAQALKKSGIEVRVNCRATHLTPGYAETPFETIPAEVVIWTGGIQPVTLDGMVVQSNGPPSADQFLQPGGITHIFVAGDAASASGIVPATVPGAIQSGRTAARNVVRTLLGLPPVAFRYHYKGDMIALGQTNAAAYLYGQLITGPRARAIRNAVYLTNLPGVRNRLGLAADWLRFDQAKRRAD